MDDSSELIGGVTGWYSDVCAWIGEGMFITALG